MFDKIILPMKSFVKESFKNKIFWIWLFFYSALTYSFFNLFLAIRPRPIYGSALIGKIFGGLALFDASNYITIAKYGYPNYQIGLEAFFPIFPLLLRSVSFPLRFLINYPFDIIVAGSFINILCFALALNFLKKLARLDSTVKAANFSMIILILFPFSFFFLSLYTESLFLLLILASFYFARQGKWMVACIFACLVGAVRLPGLLIAPALLIEFLYQKNWSFKKSMPNLLWLLIAPLGTFFYFIYLQLYKGGYNVYFRAYNASWPNRKFSPLFFWTFLEPVYNAIFKHNAIRPNDIIGLAMIMFAIFSIFCLIKYKARPSYIAFSLLSFVLPLLSGSLDSVGRYYMVVFPVIIYLGIYFEKHIKLFYFYIVSSAAVSSYLMMLFIRGVFVG